MKKITHVVHSEEREAKELRRQAMLAIKKSARHVEAASQHLIKTLRMLKAKSRPSAKLWQRHNQVGRRLEKAAESLTREANRLVKKRARLSLKVRKKFDL